MVHEALTALKRLGRARGCGCRASPSTSRMTSSPTRASSTASAGNSTALDLTPDRLVVEVLETVVASGSEDVVVRNLAGLARLGCRLDLDDFGTGHAAITSIRRFAIQRIKIDRSFVTRIDADPEQQKMVQAILTMAERLDLDTLAEGVETDAEQKRAGRAWLRPPAGLRHRAPHAGRPSSRPGLEARRAAVGGDSLQQLRSASQAASPPSAATRRGLRPRTPGSNAGRVRALDRLAPHRWQTGRFTHATAARRRLAPLTFPAAAC